MRTVGCDERPRRPGNRQSGPVGDDSGLSHRSLPRRLVAIMRRSRVHRGHRQS